MIMPETFWNIRFAAAARRLFSSTIPRGEAEIFAAAIEILRERPRSPGVEPIGDNLYQYSYNNYRIAFEIVENVKNTVRITAFERETFPS